MPLSLDHDLLRADLDAAARTLGLSIQTQEHTEASEGGRITRSRVLEVRLPKASHVYARFVREGLVARAKKLFVDEVEVGSAWFDDHVFVITSSKEATARLLAERRVQLALIMLVDETRSVEIDGDCVRVRDEDAPDDGRDASAELLALAAHLI